MKILFAINLGNYGSTGTIMRGIGTQAEKKGYTAYYVYPKSRMNKVREANDIYACSLVGRKLADILAYYTGFRGIWLVLSTWILIIRIHRRHPTVLHLHNLHNTYINLPILFNYCKNHDVKVVWTLHDCWAFTGQCPYFSIAKCDKWRTGCYDCPQIDIYPSSCVDRTQTMWRLKKKWFTGIKNMTIVTPSQWLADLVKRSYLMEYPIKVINNGIDLSIFKPTESNFREKYGIGEEIYVVLGVAFGWGKRKGLDVFIELSKRLSPTKYQIVLVGTDNDVDKQLPDNIISIHKTQNQEELVKIYTASDLLANPTREEVFGLVNIEALACGTPVVTFRSDGSPECIDETCGSVVECNDIAMMEEEIKRIARLKPYTKEACIKRAQCFNQALKFEEYINLYEQVV